MSGYGHLAGGGAARRERDRLVTEHVGMAKRIALRVARRLPDGITNDDMIAAAYLGLTQAAERFDASRGESFVAFAEKRIRGAVYDELRRGDILPRRMRTMANKVRDVMRGLEQKLGRCPEDEEMAAELGVSPEEYRRDLEGLTHVSIVELPSVFQGAANDGSGYESPVSATLRRDLVAKVLDSLQELPPRDAQVLSLYYIEEFSYAEIGEVLGVTVGRISQLHARAITRIRGMLADHEEQGVRRCG
ncbi:MAG: FliA/WhiG family RNA polymerase sigma factor [Myxococcota bacterium]